MIFQTWYQLFFEHQRHPEENAFGTLNYVLYEQALIPAGSVDIDQPHAQLSVDYLRHTSRVCRCSSKYVPRSLLVLNAVSNLSQGRLEAHILVRPVLARRARSLMTSRLPSYSSNPSMKKQKHGSRPSTFKSLVASVSRHFWSSKSLHGRDLTSFPCRASDQREEKTG